MVKGALSRWSATIIRRATMPIYEYRCGHCEKQFEATQSVHARPEDTVCPFCQAQQATRLLSAFASKVVGTHKPGFAEMKAYDMLNERTDKFSKLPPVFGKRTAPPPMDAIGSGSPPSDPTDPSGS
jgi:putative FmdB family regulatory protein